MAIVSLKADALRPIDLPPPIEDGAFSQQLAGDRRLRGARRRYTGSVPWLLAICAPSQRTARQGVGSKVPGQQIYFVDLHRPIEPTDI